MEPMEPIFKQTIDEAFSSRAENSTAHNSSQPMKV